jgi:carboxylate-amine ligase
VAQHPSRDPDAVGQAWSGQPRVTVAGTDVVGTADGTWVVVADNLRVPSGLGFALANRDSARTAVSGLFADGAIRPVDPWDAVPLLRQALAAAAPPAVAGPPRIAVLSAGESDRAWFEHQLLAEALGVPLVHAADLWPRLDGGLWATVGADRHPIDVLYRRFDDAELAAHRTPAGRALDDLLTDAVRAGRLGVANVPGNALGDDAATYAAVPEMIRFYLGEQPVLASVPTWVLADEVQWAQVRERLHELVLRPVDGYGGSEVVVGPACSSAELAQLQAEVAAAPHRFVAQEPVAASTVPALVEGRLVPRRAGLRVFSVAGTSTRVLPAPLTRVASGEAEDHAPHRGSESKDTWLLA